MRGLREGSHALAIARAYAPHVTIEEEATCLFAELGPSYAPMRKPVARARRNAAAAGVDVRPLEDGDAVVEIFLSLNRDRFGDRSRFAARETEAFVREAIPPLVRTGAIAAWTLVRGDDVLAIDLVLVTADASAPWNGGFAASAAALSPGKLLFAAEIDRAVASGQRRFDLLRGTHAYKVPWSTGSAVLQRAEIVTR